MIRIGNFPFSPDVALKSAGASASGVSDDNTAEAHIADLVQLSHLTTGTLGSRANRIAQIKAQLASPGYLPLSLPVSRKLISGALSRAA
jgi:hypothetical protein